ncbi:hypothetical protein RJ641_026005 [Dillenia turbinata]|uniref:Programmed cell death protein 4-like n=1 Tax=Dillenia turbinata TaxID=194707 RepID=A0AAN8W1Z1_9MAGN
MKNTGKTMKALAKGEKKDRRSCTGMNGSPKKGGHGGKFTWSGDGISKDEIGFGSNTIAVDFKDPNFEDPEEIVAV